MSGGECVARTGFFSAGGGGEGGDGVSGSGSGSIEKNIHFVRSVKV